MKEEKYFVIRNRDGDINVGVLEREELQEMLEEQYPDDAEFFKDNDDLDLGSLDTNYWPEGKELIIKGRVVCPKVETKVIKHSLGEED